MQDHLSYFGGNKFAADNWAGKYALKNPDGKIIEATPDDMHLRLATEFAKIESLYKNSLTLDSIYEYFKDFYGIIPQGSVMAMAGNPFQVGSLSNCIVLPKIFDSYGGIMFADQQLTQLMKRRCGVGGDLSPIRPAGSKVKNGALTSTGVPSFMERFSNTTREVAQEGRRGALMLMLDVRHPEVEDFSTKKIDRTKVTGANISVKLSDEFMNSVKDQGKFVLRYPIEATSKETAEVWREREAKSIWDVIINAAHDCAEPGIVFWDRQHYYSPSSLYPEFENIATNPCAEIAMGHDSCRLIANNMFSCVVDPFTPNARFDFEKWYQLNYDGMKLSDDLVELELQSIEKILQKIDSDPEPDYIKAVERKTWQDLYEVGKRGRRTGLGFTALGDTLAALGLRYDSKEGLEMVDKIMRSKLEGELDSTIKMAEDRGAIPAFDAQLELKWSEDPRTFFYFLRNEFPERWEKMQKYGRRNISWSTIAPTGTLSTIAALDTKHRIFGTTSGLEPVFSLFYIRRKKVNSNSENVRIDFVDANGDSWQEFAIVHDGFKLYLKVVHGIDKPEELSKAQLEEYISKSPYAGSTAPEIDWIKRVEMQSVIQKYITHSISSTINLPKDVSVEKVGEIYMKAWQLGLKGITVYRDGSRDGVLITDNSKKDLNEFGYHDAIKRPESLPAELHYVVAQGQRYGVVVGLMNGLPYEVFAFPEPKNVSGIIQGTTKKIRQTKYRFESNTINIEELQLASPTPEEQILTRLISGMLRHGTDPKFIVEQIDKCPLEIVSFGKAIMRVLKKYVSDQALSARFKCKDCGGTNVRFEEGCSKCVDCGSSKCG